MPKILISLLVCLAALLMPVSVRAAQPPSFVSVVNPVRGSDFWSGQGQPADAVLGEMDILRKYSIAATWLVRFDALGNQQIAEVLLKTPSKDERGLFLEVTPTWTQAAGVAYQKSPTWHSAGSVFLTGYTPSDREKLIDAAFGSFKKVFGYYPKSVGAWYIDSFSLGYMQKKYGISGALIVADQYTTDNYQIWGQYWSTPYYPSDKNTLVPARNSENKIPVAVMQWAARDPVNGYGGGVAESTYSVQPNDYIDYHGLGSDYFAKLVDLYTSQPLNQFNQLTVGLENSYSWPKYQGEYQKQMETLSQKSRSGQFSLETMSSFADWYKLQFPTISPSQIIVAQDPLGSDHQTVWFMNPYYRVGWFYNQEGSVFRDVRQYVDGQIEPCYSSPCPTLNFATFATRVLDDVTYRQKEVVDQGKISGLSVNKEGEDYVISYRNSAGLVKQIKFLPRDIGVDGKNSAIDSFILQASASSSNTAKLSSSAEQFNRLKETFLGFTASSAKFLLFLILALFIPGFVWVRYLKQINLPTTVFLSFCLGIVNLTLVSYLGGYLHFSYLPGIAVIAALVFFIYQKSYRKINLKEVKLSAGFFLALLLIVAGTIFQAMPMVRSGWVYPFGVGFWGPIGHDGLWHQALIAQLLKGVPPQNPAFSGSLLSNYHYFYDLLLASTVRLTSLPIADLLYRFYPVLLSALFGLGTYLLAQKLFKSKTAALFSLYLAYFAGSFGWIVEYLRERHFGGESAFWVNQPVSMELNPPFAISLCLLIAVVLLFQQLLQQRSKTAQVLLILTAGALIEFKVYAGIIVLAGLGLAAVKRLLFDKDWLAAKTFAFSLLVSLAVFLPQNSGSGALLVLSPFWFVHSMVDFPDRVGWLKLSQARQAYFARGETAKFILTEGLALAIFIIGNLGVRFVALFTVGPFVKRRLWKTDEYALLLTMAAVAVGITLLFIQKGNPWNTIQFMYYFIYFASVFAGALFAALWQKAKLTGFAVVVVLLLIAPINAVVTFSSSLSKTPPARLTLGELEALNFLRGQPEGVVLTYPFDKNLRAKLNDPFPLPAYETTSYVSAYSAKPTFVEDEIQQDILQNDYQKRLTASSDFFRGRDTSWSNNFLTENNIRYIYLPKLAIPSFDISGIKVKSIYDNSEASIFETEQ